MGRLTLNVLLSFAQFEREVTSERIRDKIAASKRKGLWVGGTLPFGYEMKDGKIAIVETEAELVRSIFNAELRLQGRPDFVPEPGRRERNFWMRRQAPKYRHQNGERSQRQKSGKHWSEIPAET